LFNALIIISGCAGQNGTQFTTFNGNGHNGLKKYRRAMPCGEITRPFKAFWLKIPGNPLN